MNICYVSEEFPLETPKGGIATYQYEIAKGMVKAGHRVNVICKTTSTNDRYEFFEGIRLHYISYDNNLSPMDANLCYRKKVCRKMKELEDSIDIFEVADWGAEAHFYLDKRKAPVVIKLHTPYFVWKKYNEVTDSEVHKIVENHEIYDIHNCDRVYACSKSIKNVVSTALNISETKINVVYNPIRILKEPKNRYTPNSKILFAGSLEQRKGVINLAEELNVLFSENDDATVIFAGKDTNRNKYNQSTESTIKDIIKKKYHNRIEFKGQLDHSELFELFSKVNIAIFPSLYENFPYVLLEAMNCKCLSIGSVHGGMPEVIKDGESGFLCTPDKKGEIYKVLKKCLKLSDDARKIIVENSAKKLLQYENSRIVNETLNIYYDVIKGWN